ncbi:MAG: hypothetical protein APF77_16145 [Clostridia bacterium BRH_c25]|nr:MAG: hypothetical protein APF77_16145 [Clostridia bacterium BRH_c25]
MIKYVPNMLSLTRIILSLVLLIIYPDKSSIFIYVAAGLTDLFDGLIARKYNIESRTGAKLDSIADFVFYCVLLLLSFIWFRTMIIKYLAPIAIIIFLRISSIIIGFVKFKNIVFIHTIANKIAGFMIFCIPISMIIFDLNTYILITMIVTAVSALEECIIIVLSRKVELDRRSVFYR